MTLEPGQRVRCVDNDNGGYGYALVVGDEYSVAMHIGTKLAVRERHGYFFQSSRFKPIVRVKMGRAAA